MRIYWIRRLVASKPLFVLKILWPLLGALLWCEYVMYYIALGTWCGWPSVGNNSSDFVSVMVLSDPHLLGHRRGHWFDKLRREWQMYRSFQTGLSLFGPEAVFLLGDIFDEGQIASTEEFNQYSDRFHRIFRVDPEATQRFVVVGNHDIGFHDRVLAYEPYLRRRFEVAFETSLVELVSIRGVKFVTVNSMALEGDDCHFCQSARRRIRTLSTKLSLNCSTGCQPILMMHFPLYRESDGLCKEPDSAPASEKMFQFRPTLDCVSKESTQFMLKTINPRLVFSGHTHNGCVNRHGRAQIEEWTVASFSWRNRRNPSFILTRISPSSHAISKCFLPNEITVFTIYVIALLAILFNIYRSFCRQRRIKFN